MWTSKMIVPGMRRGNPVKKMSPEFKKKMNEQVRKVMQQFKEIQEQIKG